MIIDLVCWVWLKLHEHAHTVCVCGVLVCTNVCVSVLSRGSRVVYKYYTHILCFSYPRNLLLGHVTKPFLTSVTQRGGLQHQDDHSNDKLI